MWKWFKNLFSKEKNADGRVSAAEVRDEQSLERYFSTDPDLTAEQLSKYDEALRKSFTEIAHTRGLLTDGAAEYYTDVYLPNDFCFKAFEYCGQQYDATDAEEMMYEYAVTAFYGAILSVAYWKNNRDTYREAKSKWDVLFGQTDMEFVSIRVREELGLGEKDANTVWLFEIICEYMREGSNVAIATSGRRLPVCLNAMRYAYKLGMLVAKKEIPVEGAQISKEIVV